MSALVTCDYCGVATDDRGNVAMVDISDRYTPHAAVPMVKVCTCCGGKPTVPPTRPVSKWSAPIGMVVHAQGTKELL